LLAVRTWQQTTIWHDSNSLWQTALEYDPKSWNAHFGLGAICVAHKDYAQAVQHFAIAHAAVPRHPGVTLNLARCLALLGRRDESIAACRAATTMPGVDYGWRHMIAESFLQLGHADEAAEQYEAILRVDPNDAEAHFQLAVHAQNRGDTTVAIRHFARVVELLEPSVRGGQSDPRVYIDANRFASACSRLVELLTNAADPAGADVYRRKSRLVTGG